MQIWQEILQVQCLHNLGLACHQAGHFHDAIKIHTTCLRLAQRNNDAAGKMRAWYNLRKAHYSLDENKAEQKIIKSQIELCQTLGAMTYLPSTKSYMCGKYSLGVILHMGVDELWQTRPRFRPGKTDTLSPHKSLQGTDESKIRKHYFATTLRKWVYKHENAHTAHNLNCKHIKV